MMYAVIKSTTDFDGWPRGSSHVIGHTADEDLVQKIRLSNRKQSGSTYDRLTVVPISEVSEGQLIVDGWLV